MSRNTRPPYNAEQRKVLVALCDTYIPKLSAGDTSEIVEADKEFHRASGLVYGRHRGKTVAEFCQRSAEDVNTALKVERTILDHLPSDAVWEIGLLLTALSTSAGTLVLSNASHASPFYTLSQKSRENMISSFSSSWLADKRKAFTLLKGIIVLNFLGVVPPQRLKNPSWDVLNYDLPRTAEEVRSSRNHDEFVYTMMNKDVTGDVEIDVDVVIVGSGCGGSVMAALLSKSQKVLLLEKSKYYTYDEIDGTEEQGFDKLYERGGTVLTEDTGIAVLAGSAFGGGSAVNWACCLATPSYVREEWEHRYGLKRFGPSSPPFTRALEAIGKRIGVKDGSSIAHNKTNQMFLDGCKACGYEATTAGQNMKTTTANAPGAGSICLGDRYGIKNSTPETFLQDAARNGCKFADQCYVSRVVHDGRRATGVVGTIVGQDGKSSFNLTVRAKKAVIVSCGAINTPALLLKSGVPNRNGMIGKNLRLHPVVGCVSVVPEDVRVWDGAPMSTVSNAAAAGQDGSHYGVKLECPSVHPSFGGAQLPWLSAADFKKNVLRLPNAFVTIALCRDKGSGSVTVDKDGMPRLHYPLSVHDRDSLVEGAEKLVRVSAAVGATSVMSSVIPHRGVVELPGTDEEVKRREAIDEYIDDIKKCGITANYKNNLFSAHQMGTARMSATPGRGVTKDTGELWAVHGLYVADSSLFPTPSGANPMVTTLALTYDMAQRLEQKLNGSRWTDFRSERAKL
jgi:choline dehydrogenase-like flavoprotein